jgi:hypothetical protein
MFISTDVDILVKSGVPSGPLQTLRIFETEELEAAIETYIDAVNADPKPFRWTKSAADILASIERFASQPSKPLTNRLKPSELRNQDTSSLSDLSRGLG